MVHLKKRIYTFTTKKEEKDKNYHRCQTIDYFQEIYNKSIWENPFHFFKYWIQIRMTVIVLIRFDLKPIIKSIVKSTFLLNIFLCSFKTIVKK